MLYKRGIETEDKDLSLRLIMTGGACDLELSDVW